MLTRQLLKVETLHVTSLLLYFFLGIIGFAALSLIGAVAYGESQVSQNEKTVDSKDLKAKIEKLAKYYVAKRKNVGLSIGVIQKGKIYTTALGKISDKNPVSPNSQTIFEIGSVTKVLTGITLAKLETEGSIALDDSISKYLPREVNLDSAVQSITLRQLATHTSGLPRRPANLEATIKDENNPYINYKAKDLYQAISQVKLNINPSKKSEYSNFGMGLLGHLLELKTGKRYEQLVKETITQPLQLNDTTITLAPAQRQRLTPGHSLDGKIVSNWDFDVLAPAGAFRSTVDDMLKFVRANLTAKSNGTEVLTKAITRSHEKQFQNGKQSTGLAWHIITLPEGQEIYWHDGGTGGYTSFIGFDKKHQTGVVILSNYGDAMAKDFSVDAMAVQILKDAAKIPLN